MDCNKCSMLLYIVRLCYFSYYCIRKLSGLAQLKKIDMC
jgi:hypothetical protein